MTTASVNQPSTTKQTLTFAQALNRAASTYEGHVDHARLVKAVEIAKNGSIEFDDDGTAVVIGSKRNYYVNGTCECDDAQFNGKYCKHYMAVELARMAYNYLKTTPPNPPTEPPAQWKSSQAPSSCTMKWSAGGVELMLTLRDDNDTGLFERINKVLPRIQERVEHEKQQRQDEREKRQAEERQAKSEGTKTATKPEHKPLEDEQYCNYHGVPLNKHTKDGRSWYSHFDDDTETWCRGT